MTLDTLEPQLGAMEPDGHGGTQAGVILWRITVCVFKFGLRAIPPRRGSSYSVVCFCADVCVSVCFVMLPVLFLVISAIGFM